MTAGGCSRRRAPASRPSRRRPARGCGRAISTRTTACPYVVAEAGTVYALVARPGSHVAALRATDGGTVWTSTTLSSGDELADTRRRAGVCRVRRRPDVRAEPCHRSDPLAPPDRAARAAAARPSWRTADGCSRRRGRSRCSIRPRARRSATTRAQRLRTTTSPRSPPASASSRTATGLLAAGPDGAARWPFTGPRRSGPITAGGHAYTVVGGIGIDEPAGLVALDLGTGAPVWCADLAIRPYPDGQLGQISGGGRPRRRAGRRPSRRVRQRRNGLNVRRRDDIARAARSRCPAARRRPAGSAAEVSSPGEHQARASRCAPRARSSTLGQRTRLTGVVTGVTRAGGRRVRIEADDSPVRALPDARARPDPRRRLVPRAALSGRTYACAPFWRCPARRADEHAHGLDGAARDGAPARCRRTAARACAVPSVHRRVPSVRARRVVFYLARRPTRPGSESMRRAGRAAGASR